MPYKVVAEGSGFVVINTDTGRKHSRKPLPRARAEAQARALYANVPEARTKAANYGAKVGEAIAGRLVRAAGGRFGSGDAAAPTTDAERTIAQNRATNTAAPKKAGGRKRAKKPRKARARKPKKARVLSRSGQRRKAERQLRNHGKVAQAVGLQEDGAASLLDLAQGKSVTDDGGLEKMGLAMVQKDGTYTLTTAGKVLAQAADAGDVRVARMVMEATGTRTKATKHTGVMLAFFLPDLVADELVRQTGAVVASPEPARDLHLTLAYLGKTDTLAESKYQIAAAFSVCSAWVINDSSRTSSPRMALRASFFACSMGWVSSTTSRV